VITRSGHPEIHGTLLPDPRQPRGHATDDVIGPRPLPVATPDLPGALCVTGGVDADVFFDVEREAEAIAICVQCPVRRECDEWATATHQRWGVWGAKPRWHWRRRARTVA